MVNLRSSFDIKSFLMSFVVTTLIIVVIQSLFLAVFQTNPYCFFCFFPFPFLMPGNNKTSSIILGIFAGIIFSFILGLFVRI